MPIVKSKRTKRAQGKKNQKKKYLWEGVGAGVWCWHIHHEGLLEKSSESLNTRAKYIKRHKPQHEIKTRLESMRPVRNKKRLEKIITEIIESLSDRGGTFFDKSNAIREIETLHKEECPNCPWDGWTLFP